jgi:hypothetical protein
LHRRPSDVTDGFSFNDVSSKPSVSVALNFPNQQGNDTFRSDPAMPSDELHYYQNDYSEAPVFPERTHLGDRGKYRGISRFQRHLNLKAPETDSDLCRLYGAISETYQANDKPQDASQPKKHCHPKDAPASGLRFFNNGVEIDARGCPKSKPDVWVNVSDFQHKHRGPALDKPWAGGPSNHETDGRLSSDTLFGNNRFEW